MADDPWAKFDKPADASVPADPWAQFAKPAGAAPEINPNPPAFQQRVEQGNNITVALDEAISEHTKKIAAEHVKQGNYGRALLGAAAATAESIPEMIARGVKTAKDILDNKVLTGPGLRREDYTDIPGDAQPLDDLNSRAQDMSMAGGVRSTFKSTTAGHPLIDAGNGEHARLITDPETGAMTSHVIGEFPPKPADFQNAATNIADGSPAVEKNLRYAWEQGGHHPAELSLDAENNPALKRDLSSAATPPLPLPPRPDPKFIQALDDTFHRLRGAHTADQSEFMIFLDKVPDTLKTAEVQQEWYKHAERDPTAEMSPAAGKAYNDYMVPLKQEELRLYEEISKSQLPVDEYNPGYMHRVVVGKAPAIDRLAGEGTDSNPIHNGPGLLARSTGSLKERKYFAAEDFKTGERHIVSVKDGELRSVGSETKFEYSSSEPLKRGNTFSVGGKSMILTDALTREIEAGTAVRYYKNALVNTIDNIMHLRAVARALSTVEQLRASPEWGKYATTVNGEYPEGWISPKMPLFKNDVMDPKMAHVIDDFYGRQPVDGLQTTLEKVNRFATGSMFWTPVPHALNAGSWWAIDRGFDWITPKGIKSLAVDGATAIREVVRQGPKYQQLLREGNSLLAGSVRNQDFFSKLAKRAGMEFEKNPEGFAEIAQAAGMKPVDLIRGMYNASSNALWSVSDMFMMQRVLELEKQGLTTRFAIEEAERYIPNYRVPPEILGSRSLQQIYTNPNLFQFSRYHYGVLKGYANVAKDFITGDMKQKTHAMGAIMVLGSLQLILWPAISAMLQAVTGEPNIKAPSAGPGKLAAPLIQKGVNATSDLWPDWVLKYYHDDTPMLNQLANLMPLAPVLKGSIEAGVTNRYNFTGRNIAEPSDVREGNWGAVAGQEAEHAAQILVEPYSAFNSIIKKGESPAMGLMERAFGLTNRTDDQEAAKERAFHYQDRAARKRQNKPQGMLERLLGG